VRVLQPMIAFSGNAPPQLAIARRLLQRGHEVTVLAHRAARERVLATGAGFVAFERSFPDMDLTRRETDTMRDWEPRTRAGALMRLIKGVVFGFVGDVALDCRDALDAWPADAVVFDWMLTGAPIAAERAGLPAVAIVHCPYMFPVRGAPPVGFGLRPWSGPLGRLRDGLLAGVGDRLLAAHGEPAIARARQRFGLPPLRSWQEQVLGVEAICAMTAPELDFAACGRLPSNVHYVGPAFEPYPRQWDDPWPEGERDPLVLISFSTSYMDQRAVVQRVLDAVAELPVRALLTLGPALASEPLRLPPNARAADYVPHRAVLPHASLMVTHAGWQTINATLAEAVPLVCVPDGRDQPDNAARVLARKAGVKVSKRASTLELRRAIAAALADDSLRQGAAAMAAALGRSDGAQVVVEHVERIVGARGGSAVGG
jgi:UDP:flavonoid glycosyltransferase YjiC (YdhE family)